ncbi:monovalent cation/H(+) antiporter subunit G [Archangium sp.]|uniref:monovalent cation/H(+) antiporter subunit G n=1 Tax=Archangium sp. TaxID=1872627 RepID=UPI002D3DE683|nr:monovalent cation/H(+) antiporter subunit G [Archangium sp.]HYO53877.1 monovalent cation/H(+) antiporter subunit G [Archangium sp.]
MSTWIAGALLLAGGAFMVVAALGVVRLPDLFCRMQAAAKTGTAGAGLLLLGTAVYFEDMQVATRALSVVAFLFLTAPVAAHLLARAGYSLGVPLFETRTDELRERFGRGAQVPGGTPSLDAPARPPPLEVKEPPARPDT